MQPNQSASNLYPMQFAHLHLHSEYSLSDGIIRIKPLIQVAKQMDIGALALTDEMNLFAAVKFYKNCIAAGIKPIIGADVWIRRAPSFTANLSHNAHIAAANPSALNVNVRAPSAQLSLTRLTLLCKNNTGYRNLMILISRSYTERDATAITPHLLWEWLEMYHEGLIVLSGAHEGEIGYALLQNDQAQAQLLASQYQQLLGDRFYIELQRIGQPQQEIYIERVVELAHALTIPVVATNNARFLKETDYLAHEARVCIYRGELLNDEKRKSDYTAQQYIRSSQEMIAQFRDIPQAIENSVMIARRCTVKLDLGKSYLPNFPVPEQFTADSFLRAQAEAGLNHYFDLRDTLKQPLSAEQQHVYRARLQTELDVIIQMGFAGYFLIVADFIRWAKEQKIMVGPGRGSGAGSLVAFALQITTIDPLLYDLLFERFLNPERVSMPDFDIDFCMEGRDRVIEYVMQFYGRESVAQIITYGTMAAKAVVRDVGRVLAYPYGFVDQIAKLIPFEIGMTLEKALTQEEMLRTRYQQEDDVRALIDLAQALEGVARNAGKHAGGVVIAPSKLTDFTALYCEAGETGVVTQFDKDDVESVGLVKFDFLGLRTLTIIDWALQTINQQRAALNEPPIIIEQLALNDEQTYRLLKQCQTTAVFQLESRGMKDLIRRLQPDCFEDIIALVALFRPGPLQSGMVDDFIDRKHGRAKVAYPHPSLEPILRPTYGVILYQEQVMQIAQVLAGYTLGGADLLRRAMGKKKPEEMAKQREIFLTGAIKNGVDKTLANSIFDLMEKFAGYGFNKSHSAAYALIAYQTAWLKAHYPAEFMAAVLSSDLDNTDKVSGLVNECREMGLIILPPAINQSAYYFTVNAEKNIRYGLGAIKGVGESIIEAIVNERQYNGIYKDLFSLCKRVGSKKLNRRALEALIRAGAFDEFNAHRAALFASIDVALKHADQHEHDQAHGQNDLFSLFEEIIETSLHTIIEYVQVPEWNTFERLQGERENLGFYLTGHPVQIYQNELKHVCSANLATIHQHLNLSKRIAGVIEVVKTRMTKRGDRMAILVVDDGSARQEVVVFGEAYQRSRQHLRKDQLLILEVDVATDTVNGGIRLIATNAYDLPTLRHRYSKGLLISVNKAECDHSFIDRLQNLLKPFVIGPCNVYLKYKMQEASVNVALGDEWRIQPQNDLLHALREWLGEERVEFVY